MAMNTTPHYLDTSDGKIYQYAGTDGAPRITQLASDLRTTETAIGSTPSGGSRLPSLHNSLMVVIASTYSSGTVDVEHSLDGINWVGMSGLTGLSANTTAGTSDPLGYVRLNPSLLALSGTTSGTCTVIGAAKVIDPFTGLIELVVNITTHPFAVGDYLSLVGTSAFVVSEDVTADSVKILVTEEYFEGALAATFWLSNAAALIVAS